MQGTTTTHTPSEAEKKAVEKLKGAQPGFGAFRAASAKEEKQWAKQWARENAQPGDMIEDEGVFVGRWQPRDSNGNSLSKTFNVYAAPEDLPWIDDRPLQYINAVEDIAALKNWHGHNGTNYTNDKKIYAALKNGSYKGGWIIPPLELLTGVEPQDKPFGSGGTGHRRGKIIQRDNLFEHQDKGAFKGTFKTSDGPGRYWTSTESRHSGLSYLWAAEFSNGFANPHLKDYSRMGCRPVRLVEVRRYQ